MDLLHDELYRNYSEQFGALLDCLIGDAASVGPPTNQCPWRSDRYEALAKLSASARRLHQHVAEHALFNFPLPDVENAFMPLLTAALDFGTAYATAVRRLDAAEHDCRFPPSIEASDAEASNALTALEQQAIDSFGVSEEGQSRE